jgi:hypothetical protein
LELKTIHMLMLFNGKCKNVVVFTTVMIVFLEYVSSAFADFNDDFKGR